jgi:hypothetical protein
MNDENEDYVVSGSVQRVEQRTPCIPSLQDLPDLDTFDLDFSPAGQLIRVTHYLGSGAIAELERHVYDDTGRLLRTSRFDRDDVRRLTHEVEYDVEGQCIGWTKYDATGAVAGHCVQRYAGGLLTSKAVSQASGVSVLEKKFQYEGTTLTKSVHRYYSQNGGLSETWIALYDSCGRLTETFGLTAAGDPLGDGRYRMEYDAKGRKVKTLSFNDWANENTPNAISIYEYLDDETGNWIERLTHHRFRNNSRWRTDSTKRKISYYP